MSLVLNGRSSVDSGAGKDRISGGDTVRAAHRAGLLLDDAKFSFGLGVGAATLTGGGGGVEPGWTSSNPSRARVDYPAARAVTLDDDTVISFVDVTTLVASSPGLALN
jgi:hypothetical protein